MSLLKQISVIVISLVLLTIASKANGYQQSFGAGGFDDAVLKKDTLVDLKKGFKNLFVTSQLGDGISAQQLNPQAISFVQDYMSRHSKDLKKMKDWGKPYFDMMDGVLVQHGLPKELKYLSVIESHLKSTAVSWAGAVGPWQFMPATARRYGLIVTNQYDERTDYIKSTHAASRMLKDLFKQYGDWLLVIAAYNGGPGNVNAAIRRSGSKDFWTLQYRLPNESKDHVKKFISTHYIMEGEGGITTLTKDEAKDALLNNNNLNLSKAEIDSSRTLIISGRYNSLITAKYLLMDAATFNRYNPGFNNAIATNGNYELRLPADKMELFVLKKYEILNESLQVLLKQAGSN